MQSFIAITIIMVSLLMTSCPPSSVEKPIKEDQKATAENGAKTPEICKTCGLIMPTVDNHEPPIGSGRGSFYLEIPFSAVEPQRYDLEPSNIASGGYFNNKIERDELAFSHIKSVAVMTEVANRDSPRHGSILFEVFEFTPAEKVRVKLWLGVNGVVPPPPVPADVIIDGDGGGSIKTKTPLNTPGVLIGKVHRTKRYVGANPNQSIVKWQTVKTVDGSEQVINEASGDDMYYMYFDMRP
ncbi:MAG: hypothetical protein HKN25_03525 [Pyrinomonadaceae bacterium]|nr:hypothetical protein [Pyrinomonadaceae bacterium]